MRVSGDAVVVTVPAKSSIQPRLLLGGRKVPVGPASLRHLAHRSMIPQPMQDRVRAAVTPTLIMIQQRQATPAVMQELRARVARDPL